MEGFFFVVETKPQQLILTNGAVIVKFICFLITLLPGVEVFSCFYVRQHADFPPQADIVL